MIFLVLKAVVQPLVLMRKICPKILHLMNVIEVLCFSLSAFLSVQELLMIFFEDFSEFSYFSSKNNKFTSYQAMLKTV